MIELARSGLLIILLASMMACTQEQHVGDIEEALVIKYLFENHSDTVQLGDTVDFAMTLSNIQFDSVTVYLGRLDNQVLLDTLTILSVENNSSFFTFVPNSLGANVIEGMVKEFDVRWEETIVKSTPFSFKYYCKSSAE